MGKDVTGVNGSSEREALRRTIAQLLELGEVAEAAREDDGSDESPVLRFGDVAVALGFVTRSQVWLALEIQRLDREEGRPHRLVGQVLQDEGWLTPAQTAEVVDALAEVVQVLRRDAARGPLVDRLSA